ncbi:MAG: hypothetical protein WA172_05195 [Terriglobales bacterium]
MRFVDEFREPELVTRTADEIRRLADPARHYRFMEVCGGHTHAIYRFGLKDLLPSNIELIHGPGCPVCVCRWAGSTTGCRWLNRTTLSQPVLSTPIRSNRT